MADDKTENEKRAEFYHWLAQGLDKGYCTAIFCANHDGWPRTDAEEALIDADDLDVCCHVVRIWGHNGKDGA